jgi:hypothetical protein
VSGIICYTYPGDELLAVDFVSVAKITSCYKRHFVTFDVGQFSKKKKHDLETFLVPLAPSKMTFTFIYDQIITCISKILRKYMTTS